MEISVVVARLSTTSYVLKVGGHFLDVCIIGYVVSWPNPRVASNEDVIFFNYIS